MTHIALVTARAARALDEDLQPLQDALAAAGARVSIVDWDGADVDWSAFDIAVLRSRWDYTDRLVEFLAWAERAAPASVGPVAARAVTYRSWGGRARADACGLAASS